ncbi:hypothetical protein ACEWY4_009059 [Coilia grayii]|uniref:Ig-like domain-containing protein n=1 Tax=Coilia grayii TaxID=363190 RepID=A0ABD1K5C6_9TELE
MAGAARTRRAESDAAKPNAALQPCSLAALRPMYFRQLAMERKGVPSGPGERCSCIRESRGGLSIAVRPGAECPRGAFMEAAGCRLPRASLLWCSPPCSVDSKVSRVAWLNRTTILFAGEEKWSLDPRVILLDTVHTEYSIKIENVDLHDEGPYVCSILSDKLPKSTKVHLIVQVPARIVNISTDITVNEGSNVSLMCLAAGRPDPSIIWKHRPSTEPPSTVLPPDSTWQYLLLTLSVSGVRASSRDHFRMAGDRL